MEIIQPDKSIELIVKDIVIIKRDLEGASVLPFFADGYPGIVFHQTKEGMRAQPQNKEMPPLFIYGQTIKPVELFMHGSYELMSIRLYPFVLKRFYNLDVSTLNDSCYDMQQAEHSSNLLEQLTQADDVTERISILTAYLQELLVKKGPQLDFTVREAISIFLEQGGMIPIKEVVSQLPITPRTFERRFLKEVGMSPKQFCQIIQFQQSLEQLTSKEYSRLTDIVYHNGYADQSHFIRVFKAYTGSTPKKFSL